MEFPLLENEETETLEAVLALLDEHGPSPIEEDGERDALVVLSPSFDSGVTLSPVLDFLTVKTEAPSPTTSVHSNISSDSNVTKNAVTTSTIARTVRPTGRTPRTALRRSGSSPPVRRRPRADFGAPSGLNGTRDREKHELECLRVEATELEQRLTELRNRTKHIASGSLTANGPFRPPHLLTDTAANESDRDDKQVSKQETSGALSLWADTAARQQKLRLAAEVENVKLKNMVAEQLRIASRLEKILNTKSRHDRGGRLTHESRVQQLYEVDPTVESKVMDELIDSLGQLYVDADDALISSGLAQKESPFCSKQVIRLSSTQTTIELLENKHTPFQVHDAGRALWRHAAHECTCYEGYYHQRFVTNNGTIARSYGMEFQDRGITVNVRGKNTMRKYDENDRVVMVFSTLVEPVEVAGQSLQGVQFREKSWLIMRRPSTEKCTDPSSTTASQTTLLQYRKLITLESTPELMATKSKAINAITDIMIDFMSNSIELDHQEIENVLLRENAIKAGQPNS